MKTKHYKGVILVYCKTFIGVQDAIGSCATIKFRKAPGKIVGKIYEIYKYGTPYEVDARLLKPGHPASPVVNKPNRAMTADLVKVGGEYKTPFECIDAFAEIIGTAPAGTTPKLN